MYLKSVGGTIPKDVSPGLRKILEGIISNMQATTLGEAWRYYEHTTSTGQPVLLLQRRDGTSWRTIITTDTSGAVSGGSMVDTSPAVIQDIRLLSNPGTATYDFVRPAGMTKGRLYYGFDYTTSGAYRLKLVADNGDIIFDQGTTFGFGAARGFSLFAAVGTEPLPTTGAGTGQVPSGDMAWAAAASIRVLTSGTWTTGTFFRWSMIWTKT